MLSCPGLNYFVFAIPAKRRASQGVCVSVNRNTVIKDSIISFFLQEAQGKTKQPYHACIVGALLCRGL